MDFAGFGEGNVNFQTVAEDKQKKLGGLQSSDLFLKSRSVMIK